MLPAGAMATVDFNPAADRLRIIGSDGTNLRANVDDGKVTKDGQLKFADSDMHKGKTPKVVAGAYTEFDEGRQGDHALRHRRDAARWSSRRRRTTACSTRSACSA